MLSVVKMLLKGEVGGRALNSHGNYIADHGKSWKNHGIMFFNFCGKPVQESQEVSPLPVGDLKAARETDNTESKSKHK